MPARRSGRTETILEKKMPSLNKRWRSLPGPAAVSVPPLPDLARKARQSRCSRGQARVGRLRNRADGRRALALGCDVSSGRKSPRQRGRCAKSLVGSISGQQRWRCRTDGKLADCPPEEWITTSRSSWAALVCSTLCCPICSPPTGPWSMSPADRHRPIEGWSAYCAGRPGSPW